MHSVRMANRFVLLLNRDFLKGLQVLLDIGPFKGVTCFLKARVQFLPKHQGQEAAEDMPPDRLIGLVKNRPGFQD